MRFNPYDDVMHQSSAASSVAIKNITGSSAVKFGGIDTAQSFVAESILLHLRTEIASGSPDAASLAWVLQESDDDVDGDYATAVDNTGTNIGGTLDCHTAAHDVYTRIEGINLYGGASAPHGGRKRWLRIVVTPTYTNGSSPGILTYGQFIGAPGSGQQLPVRTATSNT